MYMETVKDHIYLSSYSSVNLAQEYPTARTTTTHTSHSTHIDWIIDSGATNHMTPHADMLFQKHTLLPSNPRTVLSPNSTTTHIIHTILSSLTKHDALNNVYSIV